MCNYNRRVNFKSILFIEYLGTLHLDSEHVRNLVFCLYLHYGWVYKSDFEILTISLFFSFFGKKLQKLPKFWIFVIFWQYFVYKMKNK